MRSHSQSKVMTSIQSKDLQGNWMPLICIPLNWSAAWVEYCGFSCYLFPELKSCFSGITRPFLVSLHTWMAHNLPQVLKLVLYRWMHKPGIKPGIHGHKPNMPPTNPTPSPLHRSSDSDTCSSSFSALWSPFSGQRPFPALSIPICLPVLALSFSPSSVYATISAWFGLHRDAYCLPHIMEKVYG